MSKKANPTIVGAFVLAAIVLAVAAIVALGNIKFRENKFRCVAFFTGSLYGLDIGAPVAFRGVTIGRVAAIRINFDKEQNNYIIPVYIDIEQSMDLSGDKPAGDRSENLQQMMLQLINQGLRAQLKISSLLTAKLYIDLAFYPDTKALLHGTNAGMIEIPTQPSGLEQITQRLESLPLNDIINKTVAALDGINNILNSKETRNALDNLNGLLARADAEFPALAAELKKGLANFTTLSATATTFLRTADKELPPMSAELKHLLTGLNTTAGALTKTLNNIDQLTAKDSLLSYQVAASLREIERTAASIRQLTEYLQQKPNALIFGQGEEKP